MYMKSQNEFILFQIRERKRERERVKPFFVLIQKNLLPRMTTAIAISG